MMFSSSPTISTMHEFFKTASNKIQNNNSSNEDIHRHHQKDNETMIFADDSHAAKSHQLLKHPHTSTTNNHIAITNASTASSILPGTMNLFLPNHGGKKNAHHGMSDNDIKNIVLNTESFHRIQERLRVDYGAQSNSVARQVGIQLIREQYVQQQELQLRQEQKLRQQQRELQIARELTEARIKSQQALKLKHKNCSNDSSSDDEGSRSNHHHEDDRNSNKYTTNHHSPTSVMASSVSIPEDVMAASDTFSTAPLMSMNSADYDSEDGDIQEVLE